jgi:hypothetical protein
MPASAVRGTFSTVFRPVGPELSADAVIWKARAEKLESLVEDLRHDLAGPFESNGNSRCQCVRLGGREVHPLCPVHGQSAQRRG